MCIDDSIVKAVKNMIETLRSRTFWKRTLALMIPAAAQQLISIGVAMMDSLMIGQFGETQIAASSLANQLTTLAVFILMGVGTGANVMAAQFWGRGDRDSLRYIASVVLRISLIIGIILAVFALVFPATTMRFFSTEEPIIEWGSKYFRYYGYSLPLYALTTSATYLLRSTRHTKIPLIASICAFFLNIFLNWVFIFGKLGMPRMELAGAAVGTLIARAFEFLLVFIYLFKYDKNIVFRFKHLFLSNRDLFKKYIRYSLPLLFSDTLLGFGLITHTAIIGHMGEVVAAANSIVTVLNQFVTVLNIGLSAAAGVVIGNTIGEGDLDRAYNEGKAFFVISFCIGVLAAIVMLLVYPWFITLYNISDTVRDAAYQIFLSLVVTFPLATLAYVSSKGVLRGAGDTRFIMVADITLLWVVSLPLGALAGLVFHWPLFWVAFLLRLEFPAKGIWCTLRFLSRKSIKVIKADEPVTSTDD